MKKKSLIFGLCSTLAMGAALVTIVAMNKGQLLRVESEEDYWTISFDAYDLVKNYDVSYQSGDVTLKTDQNNNDVTFHYDNCYARKFNDVNYLEVQQDGSIANTTELRGIYSLTVQQMGTFKIEWGFEKEAGVVQYVASEEVYLSNTNKTYYFENTKPNYFKFTNVDSPSRQLTNFVVKMDKACEASESPYVVKSGVKYVKYSTYAVCRGFAGASQANLVIASEAGGLPVTEIAESAFEHDTTIETVTLPNTLRVIENYAFDMCTNITALNIPKSVEHIYRCAFRGLHNCSSLTFEAGGTAGLSMGAGAFDSNGHVGVLTLPSRITGLSADGYTFQACSAVTEFALNSDNHAENIVSVEDGVLFADLGDYNHGKKVLISYPAANTRTTYEIPSDCTKVQGNDGLSYANNIQKLVINNDVYLYFGSYSCDSMAGLQEIEFAKQTHTVSFYWYTFRGCSSLKSLVVPSNLVVLSCGLAYINEDKDHPLHVYLPGDAIPGSWAGDWAGSDVTNEYALVYYYSELEPATEEAKLTHWHSVADVATPWALSILFRCYRSDIGEGYAFYLLGSFNTWTANEASRGSYEGGCWSVSVVLTPNTAYTFKGAISTWDSPVDITYEVGADRSWTPDCLSHTYTVDWHY